ncbi:alpha/beta-hydrolase [Trametopsis cervina]|nr:alpha/beta-hydrolase [Trametopsis cervina]
MIVRNILPTTLHLLIASYFVPISATTSTRFHLRHAHGLVANSSRVVFSDIEPSAQFAADDVFEVSTRSLKIPRTRSQADYSRARSLGIQPQWDEAEVDGPDVRQRETLHMLAKMTNDAYYADRGKKGWYDLGPDWNTSYPFGWEPDADGFRGHVFVSEDNNTVVLSVKGTSPGWIVGDGGPTVIKDKINDNLLFSCCCARVGPTWSTVCGCYEGGYKCDQNCLEKSLVEDSLFYSVGINLYNNITYLYPEANIWLTGHSLGGSLASLMGVTFGVPVVAFEAPGERLAAARLHLPSPPSLQHITHVYHSADPIPQGKCTGVSSPCAIGGYALETGCHLGKTILYDTVSQLGWSVNARTHGIRVIVEKLLAKDWEGGVPEATEEADCVDCYAWEFGDYRNASCNAGTSAPPPALLIQV